MKYLLLLPIVICLLTVIGLATLPNEDSLFVQLNSSLTLRELVPDSEKELSDPLRYNFSAKTEFYEIIGKIDTYNHIIMRAQSRMLPTHPDFNTFSDAYWDDLKHYELKIIAARLGDYNVK